MNFVANSLMHGTAFIEELSGMQFFEETMLPFGKGRVAAMALARWRTASGKDLDGTIATQYYFDNGGILRSPQVRTFDAKPAFAKNNFSCVYKGHIRPITGAVEPGGPYGV